eukprot:1932007-Pyramimonas_sp.AAC.1
MVMMTIISLVRAAWPFGRKEEESTRGLSTLVAEPVGSAGSAAVPAGSACDAGGERPQRGDHGNGVESSSRR